MQGPGVPFSLEVRHSEADVVTLLARGEVDRMTVPALDRALEDVAQPIDLVIDLSEVTLLDTSGVGFLIRTHKHLSQIGGRLSIVAGSGAPRRILDTTRLGQFLDIR